MCSDPTRVVPSHKDSNDHKHEDEKSGDWQETGKNLKLNGRKVKQKDKLVEKIMDCNAMQIGNT